MHVNVSVWSVQSSVVGLSKLLIREKADTRHSRSFYVISQCKSSPDMYEFECRSVDQRRQCIDVIRAAIARCPHEHGTVHSHTAVCLDIQQMTLESSFANMQALNISWFYDCDGFCYVGLKLKFVHTIFTKCLLSQTSDRFAIESHTKVTTMQLLQ